MWIGSAIRIGISFSEPLFQCSVDFQHAGDGSDRIFVVEQVDRILVFENSQDVVSTKVFLNIRDRVNSGGNEEGLLSLAFHPDYESNGYFFVDYTASNPRHTVIARSSVSGTNPDEADVSSELVLLEIERPYSNHNGGQIDFGPDGYLYIMEGSDCFEPLVNCDETGLVLPIWDYDHSVGQSITGGFVYRGASVSPLVGSYIYADYITGRIWSLQYDGLNPPVNTEIFDTDLNISTYCIVNVLDVLMAVNITLELVIPTPEQFWAANCNGSLNNCRGDDQINVLDALKIVNLILGLDGCP